MSRETAIIMGITGQGAHLTDLLLSEGYAVHGIKRRSWSFNTGRIDHLFRTRTSSAIPCPGLL